MPDPEGNIKKQQREHNIDGGEIGMQLSVHRNIGNVDRTIRIMLGILLIYLAVFSSLGIWVSLLIGVFGVAMVTEGILGY